MASSSIVCGVAEEIYGGDNVIHLLVSNCQVGATTTTMEMQGLVGKAWSDYTILGAITESFGGGDWSEEVPGTKLNGVNMVYAVQKLQGFLDAEHVKRHLEHIRECLESEDFNNVPLLVEEKTHYPLRKLLTKHRVTHTGGSSQAQKWFDHLRGAGLTEFEIAHVGPELIYQTSKYYKPERGVAMQGAIRRAVRDLAVEGTAADVIRSFSREGWEVTAADGIAEAVRVNRAGLRPVECVEKAMKQFHKKIVAKKKTVSEFLSQPDRSAWAPGMSVLPDLAALPLLEEILVTKCKVYHFIAARHDLSMESPLRPDNPPSLADVGPLPRERPRCDPPPRYENLIFDKNMQTSPLYDGGDSLLCDLLCDDETPPPPYPGLPGADLAGSSISSAGLITSFASLTSSSAGLDTSFASLTSSSAGLSTTSAGLSTSSASLSTSSAGRSTSFASLTSSSASLSTSSAGPSTSFADPSASSAGLVTSFAGPSTT